MTVLVRVGLVVRDADRTHVFPTSLLLSTPSEQHRRGAVPQPAGETRMNRRVPHVSRETCRASPVHRPTRPWSGTRAAHHIVDAGGQPRREESIISRLARTDPRAIPRSSPRGYSAARSAHIPC